VQVDAKPRGQAREGHNAQVLPSRFNVLQVPGAAINSLSEFFLRQPCLSTERADSMSNDSEKLDLLAGAHEAERSPAIEDRTTRL